MLLCGMCRRIMLSCGMFVRYPIFIVYCLYRQYFRVRCSGYCLCFKYSPLILLSTRNILAVGTAYNSNTRRIYDFILRGAVVLAVFQGFILRGTAGTSLTRGVLLE